MIRVIYSVVNVLIEIPYFFFYSGSDDGEENYTCLGHMSRPENR